MKKKKYQSDILMVIHQHNEAMYKLGFVTDEEMHHFDRECLVAEPKPSAAEYTTSPVKPAVAACARQKH
jgi:DNA-binding transcriptional regulator YiaG